MGSISAAELGAHLCAGGTVVASSARAARAINEAFHRARRMEGREAWLAPRVVDWQSFSRLAWEEHCADHRLPLNSLQEQSLWERIIRNSGHSATTLEGPRRHLAAMAMQAHNLLCSHAPRYLEAKARAAWDRDASAFSDWLSAFEEMCVDAGVVSQSRLAFEAIPLLAAGATPRPALLLAGFDRLLPVQEEFFRAWGGWRRVGPDATAGSIRFLSAPDAGTELTACATWCRQRLRDRPQSRLLVVTQDLGKRRGEFERAFLREAAADAAFRFEFSLGVPLSQTAPVRGALMLLRWLEGDLAEHELDWLLSVPYAASISERAGLQAAMRILRDRGMQRSRWKLRTFLSQPVLSSTLPAVWVQRMRSAQGRLRDLAQRALSPVEWAEVVPRLLEMTAWPGKGALSSAEFQVIEKWQLALESCGSLGFDGQRMTWLEFLSELDRVADETLYAAESHDAPILIAGPAESAAITADAVWFLGADENAWPARGERPALLPRDVQLHANMPHSSPQADWELAHAITTRILTSAPEVCFSFPQSSEGVETRASRLVEQLAGTPLPLPREFLPAGVASALLPAADDAAVAYPRQADEIIHLRGGAARLTEQSRCAFKGFATGRLGASDYEPAEDALTAAERGQLLHAVLHAVWGGPPSGIRSRTDLEKISDLDAFVAAHVRSAFSSGQLTRIQEAMPARYLELEATRLTRLVVEWLNYERARIDFDVVDTEARATRTIAGLTLDLRLDRLDRLTDDSLLVIDYKTGNVSPQLWELPRPDDVQLPLYAGFGLPDGQLAGGLVFAKVRAGDMCFAGRVADARSTLDPKLGARSSIVKDPMGAEDLVTWREAIEQLARDFLAGRADVNPRDPVRTCERCGLQALCRIRERNPATGEDEEEDADE
jgi:probable DNA repair protein